MEKSLVQKSADEESTLRNSEFGVRNNGWTGNPDIMVISVSIFVRVGRRVGARLYVCAVSIFV